MSAAATTTSLPNVLMIGTGEYTTGFVHGAPSNSDKAAGIIALTVFDLRRRGICGTKIGLCGVNGHKFPTLRAHIAKHIGDRYHMDVSCDTYPADNVVDEKAYITAMKQFKPGDVIIITTPDQTHFAIGAEATKHGLHVLLAKPTVKTLAEHYELLDLATHYNTLIAGEYHKRWDPLYSDAHSRIAHNMVGPLIYYHAYMSQPKHQLTTFAAWAKDKKNSDISYYLNAHHIDFLSYALNDHQTYTSRPIKVTAMSSSGYANHYLTQQHSTHNTNNPTPNNSSNHSDEVYDIEDTITLMVQFLNHDNTLGVASFTASWTAPVSDTHTQQHCHYLGQNGEIYLDQAHRGYNSAIDNNGYATHNPLFFRYPPDSNGGFAGQSCYGYLSFQHFIENVNLYNTTKKIDHTKGLALLNSSACLYVTAILEAGRKSLDEKRSIDIIYQDNDNKRMVLK